ncbi:Gfo/Idh/MocA family protein [Carnimonas nigrificans]|uniref:Gfo/Idh/MocA family protein n=1 Tax=Carnimonas nigrificans TaxID=64323 RepID=UPI00047088CB|nr:Gfo/Idh/MocA family oxidoreductase [Carnimonas nigrificans]
MSNSPRIRIGMVGGGVGAGIATAHRAAMHLDDRYLLVAGAFSRDAERNRQSAEQLHVASERVYSDYAEMARAEAAREDGIEVVTIVTPNASHYAISKAFLEQGIHVICDKPMTDDLAQALELQQLAASTGQIFALTHNYSAYAMVRKAAEMVSSGALGELRIVQGEHASGWAAGDVEEQPDNKQAAWRIDPEQAGENSMVLDLGTHIHHLMRYVTGREVESLSATLNTVVPGRRVFDDGEISLRLSGNLRGGIWISMAATGQEHGLRLRIFGSKASLEWRHEEPNRLVIQHLDGRKEIIVQGQQGLDGEAARLTRIGLGHPEGFLEGFANLYGDIADAIEDFRHTHRVQREGQRFPSTDDGVAGLRFVSAVRKSHDQQSAWTEVQ